MIGRPYFSYEDQVGLGIDSFNIFSSPDSTKYDKKIAKMKRYAAPIPHSPEYIQILESQIRSVREEYSTLTEKLTKLIDIDLIRQEQQKLLTEYTGAWKNSWRSWCLFVDETRPDHINKLQSIIRGLTAGNLIGYLKTLEKEEKYAKAHNGSNYIDTLNSMRKNLFSHFTQDSRALLQQLLNAEVEAQRLISKEHGDERYNHKLANLSRHIK